MRAITEESVSCFAAGCRVMTKQSIAAIVPIGIDHCRESVIAIPFQGGFVTIRTLSLVVASAESQGGNRRFLTMLSTPSEADHAGAEYPGKNYISADEFSGVTIGPFTRVRKRDSA